MKKFFGWVVVFVLLASLFINIQGVKAATTILHEFSGGGSDGANPRTGLTHYDGKLYGTTFNGGDSNEGTVFRVDIDGSNFTLLHEFAGGGSDGAKPFSALLIESGVIYGTTTKGGDNNIGTIFSMNTNGTGFTLLHEFAGGANDGQSPLGSLILDTGVLYGTTDRGGDYNYGTIYSIQTDGNNFSLLHEFAGSPNEGSYPKGNLLYSEGKLYGTTNSGGNATGYGYGYGTIFSIDTDGTNHVLLHEFGGGNNDGAYPYGGLVIDSGTLYGLTNSGGDSGYGTIFSIDTNGTNFTLLHEFAGGNDDGNSPKDSLLLSNGTLFGTTFYGGEFGAGFGYGTIFSIDTNGLNFGLLHEFESGTDDGSWPEGNLILVSNNFYSTTNAGGDSNLGTIFSTDLPISSGPTSIKNTLSSSAPGELVNMTIEYTPALTTAVTDGSVKLTLAEEFDFNGISKDDVSASGGDVTWDPNEIITVDGTIITRNNSWVDRVYAQGEDSIVFGFTGDLDNTGGTITFTINGATAPLNPGSIGSYDFNVGVFSTSDGTGAALEVRDGRVAIASQVNVTATVPSTLTLTINGVASGNACSNSGSNASVTTTSSTIPFGIYTGAQTKIACQTLTVSTNATNGYIVTVEQDQDLTSAGSDTMKAFSGTYATPTTWATPPGSGTESFFGFTTDDTGYSSFQTAKYAGFAVDNTPYAIMTGPEPVVDEENVISYQLEVTNLQEAGVYSNTVMYIATAMF